MLKNMLKFKEIHPLVKFVILLLIMRFEKSETRTLRLYAQNNHTVVDSKTKCLVHFIFTYFKDNNLLVYRHVNYSEYLWDKAVYRLMQPNVYNSRLFNVEISSCWGDQCADNQFIYEQYLIFARSAEQLNFVLEKCICSKITAASSILIIATGTKSIVEMLDILKENQIYTASLIADFDEDILISHAVPPRCCRPVVRSITSTYQCLALNDLRVRGKIACKQCSLTVGVRAAPPFTLRLTEEMMNATNAPHPFQGYEVFLLEVILQNISQINHYTATNHKTVGRFDEKTQTGYGLMKELGDFDIDLFFGSVHNHNLSTITEASHPLIYATLIAVVKTQKYPRFFAMFSMFNLEIWAFIFSLFVFLCLLPYIINCVSRVPIQFTSHIFKLFTIFIGQDIVVMERPLRLVFLFWIWFSFMIRSGFEAFSTVIFMDKDSIKQIDTLEELCDRNFTIFITEFNHWNFRYGLRLQDCAIEFENFVFVKSPLQAILDSESNNVAAFLFQESFKYEITKHFEHNFYQFHVIKQSIGLVAFSYFTRRGDIFLRIIKERGLRVLDSGLLLYYEKTVDFANRKTVAVEAGSSGVSGLSMKNVGAVFHLYLCGLLISTTCFLLEIIINKLGLVQAIRRMCTLRSEIQTLSNAPE